MSYCKEEVGFGVCYSIRVTYFMKVVIIVILLTIAILNYVKSIIKNQIIMFINT